MRPPARVQPAKSSASNYMESISKLEAQLFLRSKALVQTHLLRISNCPNDAREIQRMWEYFRAYSRCKLGPVPVPMDADLKTETKWAHPESTSLHPRFPDEICFICANSIWAHISWRRGRVHLLVTISSGAQTWAGNNNQD
jgi:hypothetical protein